MNEELLKDKSERQLELIREAEAAGKMGRARALMNLCRPIAPGEYRNGGRPPRKPYELEVIRQATPDKVKELVKKLFDCALKGDMRAMMIVIELLDDRKSNKIEIHESNVMLT